MELVVSHHQPSASSSSSITNHPVLPTTVSSTSTSAYEPMDIAATAAAAYALAKNGRTPPNAGLSLELLSQILAAASGGAMSPQLFAPTWNISVSVLPESKSNAIFLFQNLEFWLCSVFRALIQCLFRTNRYYVLTLRQDSSISRTTATALDKTTAMISLSLVFFLCFLLQM